MKLIIVIFLLFKTIKYMLCIVLYFINIFKYDMQY